MNTLEFINNINRKKSLQGNEDKVELNFSKIKHQSKFTMSPKKYRMSNFSKGSPIIINNAEHNFNNNKKVSLPSDKRRGSYLYPFTVHALEYDNIYLKRQTRRSQELILTKTQKFFQNDNSQENNINITLNKSAVHLNQIEKNIKKTINNMKLEIEKKAKEFKMVNTVSPNIVKNKLTSSPNLNIVYKIKKPKRKKTQNRNKKKINFKGSFLAQETYVIDDNSFKKELYKKRNKSFDYNGQYKKKILNKFRKKLFKKSNEKSTIGNNYLSSSEDIDYNNNKYKNFSFHPNSNFIFLLDLSIIISDLYTFVVIPLNVAQNNDLRVRRPIVIEIFHFTIDLIFLLDFFISLFRGYYDYELKLIRNNKTILIHYLKTFFVSDFLQAIPLYTIIRIIMKPDEKKIYLGYSETESILISFLLFIKPFKIFKIFKKKQNKALEDFYSYLSENYYFEQLVRFLIYFIYFFLFVHLFICLHIYFAFQSYPNWIVHTNIINESFSAKYIASLYFMVTTMTTVGYGDIICISFLERIYHIILLVIGTLLYTFLVSKIGNYLRDQSHEQIKLSKDLNILENIRISYPTMSFKLYSKIKSHLLSIFNKRKKTGISLLINGVPDAIKNDLLFKIYSKVINGFKIFKDVKNSNFVLQMLTSFIPILSKKEEIIVLEGEIIQNIVFVKDGRLSMEIAIDINNPFKSIHKYLEINFIGISKHEELKNYNYINRVKSIINIPKNNYNDLKEKIDNILSDNNKKLVNNSIMDNNGISVDLGRLDFSRNEIDLDQGELLHIIKIIDIRKNEHFGDVHMFLEKPSPFTIKAKSRVAELLLLRRHDALIISKTFPNIWRKIENKSYHNLVSFKKLTFQILKRYYNNHCNNKSNKERFSFDVTKNLGSEFSYSENRPSFPSKLLINKSQNISINKSYNKSISINKNYKYSSKSINNKSDNRLNILEKIQLKPTKTKNYVNKNKLFVGYNLQNKNANITNIDNFSDNLNFSSDSSNMNSIQSYSLKATKRTNSINNAPGQRNELIPVINISREVEDENDKVPHLSNFNNKNINLKVNTKNTDINGIINKKTNDNITFKSDNQINKLTLVSPKHLLDSNKTYKNSTFIKSQDLLKSNITSKKQSDKTIKEFTNCETIKCYTKNNDKTNNDKTNNNDFLTLEDVGKRFSKRIKKKIKKRKKIQKLKELLKLQRLKIDKNIIELYLNNFLQKQKSNGKININSILLNKSNNFSYSLSSNNKRISQIVNSSSSEGGSTTLIQSNNNFNHLSLKVISCEFFEIKSSYKNINSLSKGNMIYNLKYQKNLEYLIKKYLNKNISNNDDNNNKSIISLKSLNSKHSKNKVIKSKKNETERSKKSNSILLSENKKSTFSKNKNNYSVCINKKCSSNNNNDIKNYSNKYHDNNSLYNNSKIYEEDNGNNKIFEKEKMEGHTFNKNDIKSNEYYVINIKKEVNKNNILGKQLFKYKKPDKIKEENITNDVNNNMNDVGMTTTTNPINEYDKDNKLTFLNKTKMKNMNSCTKMIHVNNTNEENNKNCIIL